MIGLKHLPQQKNDEEVIFLLRRDISVLLFHVALYVVISILPFGAYWFINTFFQNLLSDPAVIPVLNLILVGFYMFVWLFFYRGFLDYFLDVWIVTNHRILNIELEGLFKRTVTEVKLFRIQDVTTEQTGLLAHFLNYGDVYIQSAGTRQRVVFEQVPNPNKVARQIVQLVAWYKKAYPNTKS